MNRCRTPALVLGVAFALCGCGSIPTTHYYLLEPQHVRAPISNAGGEGLSIGVSTFAVDPPYDQDRIAYRISDGSLEIAFYDYHRWAVPLARMLPAFMAESLRGTPGIAAIEPHQPSGQYDATLKGRVRIVEEVDQAEHQRVRLHLDLTLIDASGETIRDERLVAETSVDADDVEAIVRAMSETLEASVVKSGPGLVAAFR